MYYISTLNYNKVKAINLICFKIVVFLFYYGFPRLYLIQAIIVNTYISTYLFIFEKFINKPGKITAVKYFIVK